jgi:hypothetical protein
MESSSKSKRRARGGGEGRGFDPPDPVSIIYNPEANENRKLT